MLLRGFTDSGIRVDFTLHDCPILVTSSLVALAGIKQSKLIRYDTICRGDEETGIFEGDEVYEDGKKIGTVVYAKGFFLQTLTGALKTIPKSEHIKMKEGNVSSSKIAFNSEYRTDLSFSYKGQRIIISMFICKDGSMLSVAGKNKLVNPDSLLMFTGYLRQDNRGVYFGEFYQGGKVVLHDLKPMIKIDECEFVDIETN